MPDLKTITLKKVVAFMPMCNTEGCEDREVIHNTVELTTIVNNQRYECPGCGTVYDVVRIDK